MASSGLVKLLQELVAIPSVNPQGDPGVSKDKTGEGAMASYVSSFMKKAGWDVELQMVFPKRPNVVGRAFSSRSSQKKPILLLCPHMDTVSVLGMTIDPFDPVIKGGRLFGRGACDDKGPMAAMLWALKNVTSQRPSELKYDVIFAAVVSEESGNDGIRHLVKSGIKADFGIAGEPTDLNPVYTHKGAMWMELSTAGKAVHSSQPHRGHNAIYDMARAITYLETEYFPKLQKIKNRELGAPTLSVGTIQGGSKVNIVPDHCRVEVDFRTVPGQNQKAMATEICAALKKRGIPVKVTTTRGCMPLYTDPKNINIQKLSHWSRKMAKRGKVLGAPWFCDAAIAAGGGIPSIAWGPGSIAQAHTKDEYIDVRELELGAAIFEKFLTE